MAAVSFEGIGKVYDDGTTAVTELDLVVNEGEFLVLVGPSGCGKSTTLRMLAGLEDISEGVIRIGDAVVNDLPARARGLGMVFQSYALYPHMSVEDNLTFGLRMKPKAERPDSEELKKMVKETSAMLGIDDILEKRPRDLSGGQRQRVALGRALIRRPKVLLMDEPLSNLDAKLRNQMRLELRRLHDELGTTTIYVTHDQIEAMTLADRIAVMKDGVLQQHCPPLEAYHKPANPFVASFLGTPPMNLIEGTADGGVFSSGSLSISLPDHLSDVEGKGTLGIRPENVKVLKDGGVDANLSGVERLGSETIFHLDVEGISIKSLWHGPSDESEGLPEGKMQISLNDPSAVWFAD
tara:strand:+ start:153 stop:1208 length:1056 start_codon:yes stop_codon:yes gene_type:complete